MNTNLQYDWDGISFSIFNVFETALFRFLKTIFEPGKHDCVELKWALNLSVHLPVKNRALCLIKGKVLIRPRIKIRWDGSDGQAAAESLVVNVLPTSGPASLRYPKGQRIHQCKQGFTWSHERRSHKPYVRHSCRHLEAATSDAFPYSCKLHFFTALMVLRQESGLAQAKILTDFFSIN